MNFPPEPPTLAAPRLHLRPLAEADIPTWFARATDAESAALAGDPIPTSIAQGSAWLEAHRRRFRDRTAIRWAIVPGPPVPPGLPPASIGTIGLSNIDAASRTAELGLVIARAYWHQGLGTEAARLVTGYAFATLGLARIHAESLRRNHPSRRLLDKLGFGYLCALPADPHQGDQDDADLYVLIP